MLIDGQNFKVSEIFDRTITVPDCFVWRTNKIGHGNGEAKLYVAGKDEMAEFFHDAGPEGMHCILLKSDLISYLETVRQEYVVNFAAYSGGDQMPKLWEERMEALQGLPEVISFRLHVQSQITGPRGYVKSSDDAYELIRQLSLPNITYLSVMRLADRAGGAPTYYFRLFVDFDALKNRGLTPLVYRYGKKKEAEAAASQAAATPPEPAVGPKNKRGRDGQAVYRQKLLDEQVCCPITGCTEERLLIASHIKPWAACNEREKYDPMNGFLLSPLYDRLFDQGFITFTEERIMLVSDWLSSVNRKRLGLKDGTFCQRLPVLPERLKYMTYHQQNVFKGKLRA